VFTTLPSAAAHSLANMGISEIHATSYTSNPATLALSGDDGVATASYSPGYRSSDSRDLSFSSAFFGTSATIPKGSDTEPAATVFGLAYYFTHFGYGEFARTDEVGNLLGTIEPYLRSHNLVLSASRRGAINASIGVTVRHWRTELVGQGAGSATVAVTATATAFDFGSHLSRSFRLASGKSNSLWFVTPAVAATYHNLGSDFDFSDSSADRDLPTMFRLAAEVAIERRSPAITLLKVVPMFEWQCLTPGRNESIYHLGGRIELMETVYFRKGVFDDGYSEDDPAGTWGIALSTRGFTKERRHGATTTDQGSFFDRLDLDLSYAPHSIRYSNASLLELALTFDL